MHFPQCLNNCQRWLLCWYNCMFYGVIKEGQKELCRVRLYRRSSFVYNIYMYIVYIDRGIFSAVFPAHSSRTCHARHCLIGQALVNDVSYRMLLVLFLSAWLQASPHSELRPGSWRRTVRRRRDCEGRPLAEMSYTMRYAPILVHFSYKKYYYILVRYIVKLL